MGILGDEDPLSGRLQMTVSQQHTGDGGLFKIIRGSVRWAACSLTPEGLGVLLVTTQHPYQPKPPSLLL